MSWIITVLAFAGKEIRQVLRQPKLMGALLVGPFVILGLFAVGFEADPPPLRALVVSEDESVLETLPRFQEEMEGAVEILETTSDRDAALARLAEGEVELVIVAPDDFTETIRSNQQAMITVWHDRLDPFDRTYIAVSSRSAVDSLNRALLSEVVAAAQEGTDDLGRVEEVADEAEATSSESSEASVLLDDFQSMSPEVIVRPFTSETALLQGEDVPLTSYYAPAVVVVLLQHVVLTFAAMSVVNEISAGAVELLRVGPVRLWELITGKFLGYAALGLVVGGTLMLTLVFAFGTPMLGTWLAAGTVLVLTLTASLGLGFVIAAAAGSQAQAVQFSMLALLFTIFFSGLVVSNDRLVAGVQELAFLAPATAGTQGLQDVMFRGNLPGPALLAALVIYAVLTHAIAYAWLRRRQVA